MHLAVIFAASFFLACTAAAATKPPVHTPAQTKDIDGLFTALRNAGSDEEAHRVGDGDCAGLRRRLAPACRDAGSVRRRSGRDVLSRKGRHIKSAPLRSDDGTCEQGGRV